MTWQQACDAIDYLTGTDDGAEYPAIQWYERELDAAYDPENYDEAADRGDWEYHQWADH